MSRLGMTVVETAAFARQAGDRLSDSERWSLIAYLATNPEAGPIMVGTGGVRKVRWVGHGSGKRGGVRVVYYYHNDAMPLFLLSVFAKNEKANLTDVEKQAAKKLVKALVETYTGGSHG